MTTLPERPNSALVVIDVQNGVMVSAYQRDAVVARIRQLMTRARGEGIPVIWVQHANDELEPGSHAWNYVPELVRDEAELLIHKRYGDAFEDTELERVLQHLAIGRLFICGAQTDACIRSTLHGALARGYDTILISDAHTTDDQTAWGAPPPEQVIAHTNLYWSYQEAPGRTAGTASSTEVRLAP